MQVTGGSFATRRILTANIGLPLAAALFLSSAFAEEVQPVFAQALPDVKGSTFTVAEVTFMPGDKAAAHRHGRAFVYAYVLDGEIRSQLAGEPARVYKAGESWFEARGARHLLTENPSKTAPARLLVVFVAPTGSPLKTPDLAGKTTPSEK